jgi:hypothetical protein
MSSGVILPNVAQKGIEEICKNRLTLGKWHTVCQNPDYQ